MWLSKRQSTCETSVFGAEFVALKQGIEALRGLRYKLRMMGIPIAGPSYVHCDNKSVVTNSSIPESMLTSPMQCATMRVEKQWLWVNV